MRVSGAGLIRTAVRVEGIVQGVGFRPFVYTLATGLGLAGLVGNDLDGVFVEVEGPAAAVSEFLLRLERDAPPLARIERVTTRAITPRRSASFAIAASEPGRRIRRAGGSRRIRRAAPDPGIAGHRDLRRLPARARRSGRPAVRVPVHQLHQLRT